MAKKIFLLLLIAVTACAQESPHGAITLECGSCHTTESWKMKSDARFDHASVGFSLTGQHKAIPCASCHRNLRFAKSDPACTSCHTDVHRSELGAACARCHGTDSWKLTDMVQRHQQTRFPLLGAHATTPCQSCHPTAGNYHYAGAPTNCVGCHRPEFMTAGQPGHVAARFSTDCSRCHRMNAMTWHTSFDHSLTAFPLTGAHRAVSCSGCHADQLYAGKPVACFSCHQAAYNGTTNPAHAAANFPTDCQTCHTTISWSPASFNHSATGFPLTGAHIPLTCDRCHGNGNYLLTYNGCYTCHTNDYAGTANPAHAAAGFPTTCETCHSTSTWAGATFNHTFFPTNHGNAGGVCATCHTNPSDFTVFQCIGCHTQAQTDPQHTNVQGYVWDNANCYRCHPRGSTG